MTVNSHFFGVGLMSNNEEGGSESSGTNVVTCQCLMGCNLISVFLGAFDFSFCLADAGCDVSNT